MTAGSLETRHAGTIVGVWSVFAALVPSAAALAVAADVLLQQGLLRRESDIRERISEKSSEFSAWLSSIHRGDTVDYAADMARVGQYETRWLSYYGLAPRPSLGAVGVTLALSAPILPDREITRQRVLLLSGVAGIVFLGIDLSLSGS